jgi:hypothetical protein
VTLSEEQADRPADLVALDAFAGEWTVRADLADAPAGRTVFEWALGRQYLLQRSASPGPGVPESLAIVARGAAAGSYVQHYFDSRGVVRIYRMELRGRQWTLLRTAADFSSLDFSQRFQGEFSADRSVIEGQWEMSRDDGVTWSTDFGLTYTRLS